MRKGWILSLMTVLLTAFGASAQEVTARIAGLENNTEYMEMLRKEAALQIREDSITKVVHRVRQLLRDNPEQRNENTAEILRCEELLFTIRTERGKLTDRINTIEQDWVLANLDLNSQAEEQRAHTAHDGGSPLPDSLQRANLTDNVLFRKQLPAFDYGALQLAQRRERDVAGMIDACMDNYGAIESLKITYDTVSAAEPAAVLYERYETLQELNRTLCDSLSAIWSRIYDNKNYAYAYILDKLGREELLASSEEKMAAVRQQIAAERGMYYSDELMSCLLQKRAMTAYETALADALGMTRARDSLKRVGEELQAKEYRLPKLYLEERLFLDYAPIGFVSPAKYNASNPIPEAARYDRGTIYRILLATYTNRTNGGYLFKGAYPLGYEKVDGKYAYYAGGFRTLEEAREALAEMKKRGFRRPEIVVWNDGVRTNLADAEEEGNTPSFRVEASGLNALSEESRSAIENIAGSCEISRAGQLFILGPFADKTIADRVADLMRQQENASEVKVAEIVE